MAKADCMLSMPPINTPVDPRQFETLKDAEDTLKEQGFKLVPDTCNWTDDAGQIDAGVYPVEQAYGVSKYRIEYRALDATPSRRRFLTVAAVASVVGASSLAVAAMVPPIPAAVTTPSASPAFRTAFDALRVADAELKTARAANDAALEVFGQWEDSHPRPKSKKGGRRWQQRANAYYAQVTSPAWQALMKAELLFAKAQTELAIVPIANAADLHVMAACSVLYDRVELCRENRAPIGLMIADHLFRQFSPAVLS